MEVAEMNRMDTKLRRATLAALMLAAMSAANSVRAAGTPSGTSVSNLATIDYAVGGVTQLPIESSPAGNSTPGAGNGAPTSFVVDNRVDLTVAEAGASVTQVGPGQIDALTAFTVTNTGNTTQDYALGVVNLAPADAAVLGNLDTGLDVSNFRIRVDGNGNGTYEPATDTATFVGSLAPDATVRVFVLADVPLGALDNGTANVRLTAVTHVAGSGASNPVVETTGANTNGVDVVFADAGRNAQESAADGYRVASARLTITKASSLVSDPVNGTTAPKAVPGAVVEYSVTVANGGTQPASGLRITDVLSADIALVNGAYAAGSADIAVEVGVGPATTLFCTADAGEGDGDGCGLAGATLQVGPTGLIVGTTAADNPVRVLFRAAIQ
jgi:uncharacterized repeat protein (TIGR01451 family)